MTLDVVPVPTVTPAILTWVETEQPAAQALAVTRDQRVQITSVTPDVAWIAPTTTGTTITLSGNAQSAARMPGALTGSIRTTFTLGTRQRIVTTPINATVTRALSGPAELVYEVNASTQAADLLNRTSTVTTATQTAVALNLQSNAPWLIVSGTTTGTRTMCPSRCRARNCSRCGSACTRRRSRSPRAAARLRPCRFRSR